MISLKPIIIITLSWYPQIIDEPKFTQSLDTIVSQHHNNPDIYSTQDYIDHNHTKLLDIIIQQEYENDAR